MFLDVQQVVAQFIFDASGMGAPLTGMDWTSTRPHRSTDDGPRANHHVGCRSVAEKSTKSLLQLVAPSNLFSLASASSVRPATFLFLSSADS